ncbi:MAG TPA: NADPH-dependent FMN reductase, partial [Gemmatimonadales bacterium]|nr:NADPH-dependent FMN reductase [Gemmatimonadales bacterium]
RRRSRKEDTRMAFKVGVFVGSLSKKSINRRLARALKTLSPDQMELVEIPIGDLPLYNYDFDNNYPPEGRAFKKAVEAVDALMFVTPEYNRSIPGPLKNAIDWGSRPYGKNSFAKKPSAVIGTSPGSISTAVGQQHLRSILSYVNSPELAQPEAYIQFTDNLITEDGEVTDESTKAFLREWLDAFEVFIGKVTTAERGEPAEQGS